MESIQWNPFRKPNHDNIILNEDDFIYMLGYFAFLGRLEKRRGRNQTVFHFLVSSAINGTAEMHKSELFSLRKEGD